MYPSIKNIFKLNQLFYLYCMILLAFLYTQPTHAQNAYSNCSETQTQQLIQKFNLKHTTKFRCALSCIPNLLNDQ